MEAFSEHYKSGPYQRFEQEHRNAGSLGTRQILAHQFAHAFSDPPSTDLVIGKAIAGTASVKWRYGGGRWNSIKARRPGHIGISPLNEQLDMQVSDRQIMQITMIPIRSAHAFLKLSDMDTSLDFGHLQGPTYWRDPFISSALDEIWRTSSHGSKTTDVFVDSVVQSILLRLLALRDVPAKRKRLVTRLSSDELRTIDDLLFENIAESITVNTVARELGLSIRELHRRCYKTTGRAPYQYFLYRRISAAKDYLSNSEKSLVSIALELGFCDQSHFSKVFKDQVGETPAQFRKSTKL